MDRRSLITGGTALAAMALLDGQLQAQAQAVRGRAPGFRSGLRFGQSANLWTPSQIATRLWLKGDELTGANNSTVSTWPDASGGARNATAVGSTAARLFTSNLNNKNVVDFSGVSGSVSSAFTLPGGTLLAQSGAVFFLANAAADPPADENVSGSPIQNWGTSGTASHYSYTDGNVYHEFVTSSRPNFGNPSPSLTAWRMVYIELVSGTSLSLYIDDTLVSAQSVGTASAGSSPRLGTNANGIGFIGQLAEVVYHALTPTVDLRQRMAGYAAAKWGLQGNLPAGHPYKSSAPTA